MKSKTRRNLKAAGNQLVNLGLSIVAGLIIFTQPQAIVWLSAVSAGVVLLALLTYTKAPFRLSKMLQYAGVVVFAELLIAVLYLIFLQILLTTGPTEMVATTFKHANLAHLTLPVAQGVFWGLMIIFFKDKGMEGVPGQIGRYIYPKFMHVPAERFASFYISMCYQMIFGLLFIGLIYGTLRHSGLMAMKQTILSPLAMMGVFLIATFGNSKAFTRRLRQAIKSGWGFGPVMLGTVVTLVLFTCMLEHFSQHTGQIAPMPPFTYQLAKMPELFGSLIVMMGWLFVPIFGSLVVRFGQDVPFMLRLIIPLILPALVHSDVAPLSFVLAEHIDIFSSHSLMLLLMTLLLVVAHTFRDRNNRFFMTGFDPVQSTRFFGLKRQIYGLINLPMLMVFFISILGWLGIYFMIGIQVVSLMLCFIVGLAAIIKVRLGSKQALQTT